MGGGETSCERAFSSSLSHGEGGTSLKSCTLGTSHSDKEDGIENPRHDRTDIQEGVGGERAQQGMHKRKKQREAPTFN